MVIAFAIVIMSGATSKRCAANGAADTTEPGDDLIEDEQDAVLVAYLTQTLEIARGRHDDPAGARDRLDYAGGDRVPAVEIDDALQVIGQLDAVLQVVRGSFDFDRGWCGACG